MVNILTNRAIRFPDNLHTDCDKKTAGWRLTKASRHRRANRVDRPGVFAAKIGKHSTTTWILTRKRCTSSYE